MYTLDQESLHMELPLQSCHLGIAHLVYPLSMLNMCKWDYQFLGTSQKLLGSYPHGMRRCSQLKLQPVSCLSGPKPISLTETAFLRLVLCLHFVDCLLEQLLCRASNTGEAAGRAPALRAYQQEVLGKMNHGGNFIVVAPTGRCTQQLMTKSAFRSTSRFPL